MVKISKYSKEILLNLIKLFNNRIYVLFYDLDYIYFRDVTNRLSKYMKLIETKIIKVGKENCLVLFGYLDIQKLGEFTLELDRMDIGEFDISEYSNKQEEIKVYDTPHRISGKNFSRKVYVNKDEKIIQLYNFQ